LQYFSIERKDKMSVSGIQSSTPTVDTTNAAAPASDSDISSLASEDTFLKLFVAQLQNQDPLNPDEQSGTQMVSELAQFSQLEQTINIGKDVHSIAQGVSGSSSDDSSSTTDSPSDSQAA
jgi:flagellar basal-body rod modification protein FlgD